LNQDLSPLGQSHLAASTEFREPLERFVNELEKFTGKKTRKAPSEAWGKFLSLPQEVRQGLARSWAAQADFIRHLVTQGVSPSDELEMLKQALRRLSLLVDYSLLPPLEKGDVIEVLTSEHTQVYCSFSCFALCNYSILEMSSYPYYELYGRATWVINQLLDLTRPPLEGKANVVSLEHLPEYALRELRTEEKCLFSMREKLVIRAVSALTHQNYLVTLKRIRPIPTAPDAQVTFI
jgi:hypothetical protein